MNIPNRDHSTTRSAAISRLVFVGILLFLTGVSSPPQSFAQGAQYEQIQEYIHRNAELLELAHELVRETENILARRVLGEALNLHRRSQRLLNENRPLMSYNTAKNCRTAIRNSVRLARESMGFEERVRLRSERFRDQHAHLLEQAREANNQMAMDFLRRSEKMAIRAYEQYRQGDARLAFKMLEQAEELMNRAARMLARDGSSDHLDRSIEMAQLAVERVREKLQDNGDPAAWKLLTESEQTLDRALDFRDQGQPGRALQMAGLAQRLANRAADSGGSGPGKESARRQIERWDHRFDGVSNRVMESDIESARRLLQKARGFRDQASQSMDHEDYEPALRQIRTAHDLLSQVEKMLR